MVPGNDGRWGPADLAVKTGGATLYDLQDVQLAGEQGLPEGVTFRWALEVNSSGTGRKITSNYINGL